MKKVIKAVVLVMLLAGCFHEWPDSIDSYYRVTEGPLQEGGTIEAVGYQNCVNLYNCDVVVSSDSVTINGAGTVTIDSNGDNWLWLDVSMLSAGDVFIVTINGDTKYYEVI